MSNIRKIVYIGICFTVLFTAFVPAQNLISKIYEKGFGVLGQVCVFTMFLFQAVGGLFVSHYKKRITHRVIYLIVSILFTAFIGVAAFTSYCNEEYPTINQDHNGPLYCQLISIYILNVVSCVFLGISGAFTWAVLPDYLNLCSSEESKGADSGVFWTLMQMAQIFGSSLASIFLQSLGAMKFFSILFVISSVGILLFAFLPPTPQKHTESIKSQEAEGTFRESLKEFKDQLVREDTKYLRIPMILIGVTIAFYASFLFIVANEAGANDDLQKQSIVALAIAIGEVCAGLTAGRISDKFDKMKVMVIINCLPFLATGIAVLAFLLKNYALVVICAWVWGYIDTALNTIIFVVVGSYYEGRLELFSICVCLSGLGCMFASLLAIVVESALLYMGIIIGVLIAFQVYYFATFKDPRKKVESLQISYAKLNEE